MTASFVTTFHEKPYRHYQVDGVRVPSVTKVIGATVDKSGPLKVWAQRETVNALDSLQAQYGAADGIFRDPERLEAAIIAHAGELSARAFCDLYESQQTTLPWGRPADLLRLVKGSDESMHAKMARAAERGLALHAALEAYAENGDPAALDPTQFPPEHHGYVRALASWITKYRPRFHGSEVIVGSLKHRYGGRLDHHLTLAGKAEDSYGQPLVGRGLVDLKTNVRGRVYAVENFTQAEAYEVAAVESGNEPTDYRAVLAIGPDGSFEFRRSTARAETFTVALAWFHEQQQIERGAKAQERGKA